MYKVIDHLGNKIEKEVKSNWLVIYDDGDIYRVTKISTYQYTLINMDLDSKIYWGSTYETLEALINTIPNGGNIKTILSPEEYLVTVELL